MKIGFVGLGKMGSQMVARLLQGGHEVVVIDHHQENIDAATARGAEAAADRPELVAKLGLKPGDVALPSGQPAVVWLMIAAHAVDAELEAWLGLLPVGSIIVDGGNSDFRDTLRRAKTCQGRGVQLVDVGTSGGILGMANGFSMMIGGEQAAYQTVTPLIHALAQPDGYAHLGPTGAGHYIKMIHNAIEYGVMESYAEGYRLLHDGAHFEGLDLAKIAEVWQHGSIVASGLNALIAQVLAKNPQLDGIDGFVHESGEARWTLETAAAEQPPLPMPAIQSALDARLASQQQPAARNFGTKLLAAMRGAFGGHQLNQ